MEKKPNQTKQTKTQPTTPKQKPLKFANAFSRHLIVIWIHFSSRFSLLKFQA